METEITHIWDDFHRELKGFIYSKVRNSSDTDDLLQEVFLKIIRHYNKVEQSTNLRHYIYGIVRNAITDYFRSTKSELREAILRDLTEDESDQLNATVGECCVRPFIQKLPEHYREALLLTEFQHLSQKELAERLGISYSGAKSRIQRGKEKLKELILSCCAYESDRYGNLIGENEGNCGCS